MKLKLKLTATTFTKIASPRINCNMKEKSLRLYEKQRVMQQKSDISFPRYVTRMFPFWFKRNEIGYDYVDCKQQSFV